MKNNSPTKNLKVAIVHDWLVGGGAELVVLELHHLFPDAPIYTSYCTPEWRIKLDDKVVTGYLQLWPFSRLRKYLPVLRQRWFRKIDLQGFDVIISSSGNGEAKFITAPKPAVHVCYCHTPTHFYWRHYDYYRQVPGFGLERIVRFALKVLRGPLRKKDYAAAQRVDHFIANSSHIQADIKKYYGRDSVVIYPPVGIERFSKINAVARHGFITVGRQVPYKRVDIIVDACTNLNLPLTVIGRGPEHEKLKKRAGPSITFMNSASDNEVTQAISGAQAFILAAFEDFGITPVEALASGTPVIAYKAGGALDYVEEGKNGLFFGEQTSESLLQTLKQFGKKKFDYKAVRASAEAFSAENFRSQIKTFVDKVAS